MIIIQTSISGQAYYDDYREIMLIISPGTFDIVHVIIFDNAFVIIKIKMLLHWHMHMHMHMYMYM